jgi:pimeloyl-ACP methyl ester carboxylesterase
MSSAAVECVHSEAGSGPPLLLVHGVGAQRTVWDGVTEQLCGTFRCISYDLRGHGESPKPHGDFGLDDLVTDLEALRARLGIARAHVIGHSLGGMVAPAYARRFPERVLSVGMLSTVAGRSDEERAMARMVGTAMAENGVESALDILVRRWFTDGFLERHPDRVEQRKRQVAAMDPALYLNTFRIYTETEMAPWLHEVGARTLVLTGEHDAGCSPAHNRRMAESMPDAQLVVLDGLRHGILLEAPDRVAAALAAFLG